MPAAIAMATSKRMSPVLVPGGGSVSTISIPVSAYHDPANNVITITPYILLKTTTGTTAGTTVAEQMQALRQEKKIGKAPDSPAGAMRVKRRADLSKLGLPEPKPASVSRRNARERNRVKQVNQGFETLREHVPNGKKNKKMSKVQTLRSAAQYIKDLYMILHGELPALGSPNVVDEHDPDSPLDTSDIEMNVSSPESLTKTPTLQQQTQPQHFLGVASPPSVVCQQSPTSLQSPVIYQQSQLSSPQFTPTNQPQQRHKAVPLILKKEPSVLHQQLARALQQSPSVLKQQLQAPLPVQPVNLQLHQRQLRLALNQMQSITLERRDITQEEIHSPMSTSVIGNHNHLSTSDISDHNPMEDNDQMSSQDSDTSLHSDCSPVTYTQLSPAPYIDSGYTSSDTLAHRLLKPSPHGTSDLNMNLVSSDLSMLHNYFRSVHGDQEKLLFSDLTRTLSSMHSPAPSLSSMGSSSGSDVSVVYDCESVDKEALLDISNWISELCSNQVDNDLGHN